MNDTCFLVLDDGTVFPGVSFGAPPIEPKFLSDRQDAAAGAGEVVFNTSMTGYHEILSDPSYSGQLVVMTYPHTGNYGIQKEWSETGIEGYGGALRIHAAGFIARRYSGGAEPRGRSSLDGFLSDCGVPGIHEVDTRALTLRIREGGSPKGIIVASEANRTLSADSRRTVLDYLSRYPDMEGRNLVSGLGVSKPASFDGRRKTLHFAIIDCGLKSNILRELAARSCSVTVFPNAASVKDILAVKPDAVVVSNGPGDPAVLKGLIGSIRELIGSIPVFGICLGHQLIALALGAETYKMKFGHHGANHPVRDEVTKKVFVTSQNHGFSVKESSLPESLTVWLRNANDGTIEGLRHKDLSVSCVQFHPEAAPGPRDSVWIFDEFVREVSACQRAKT